MRRSLVVTALALGCATAAMSGPATAHEMPAELVPVIDAVRPTAPAGVVVQAHVGIAAQLVAANPTATDLEVIGETGRPFLRISRRGVFADIGSSDFHTTSSPTGRAPTERRPAREPAPSFTRISAGSSWGWYDHRLHPLGTSTDPPEVQERRFEVPLRYGGRPLVVHGRMERRPVLGSFVVTAEPAPVGLRVDVLQGRLPGLLVAAGTGASVTLLGRDDEPFVRLRDGLTEVNLRSRTHVEDRQARGVAAGTPGAPPAWQRVGSGSHSWLDARLRYPRDLPPEEVLRARRAAVVARWEIPVVADGRQLALRGAIRWEPRVGARETTDAGRSPGLVLGVLGGGLAALALTVLTARRRTARPRTPAHTEPKH